MSDASKLSQPIPCSDEMLADAAFLRHGMDGLMRAAIQEAEDHPDVYLMGTLVAAASEDG